MTKTFTTRMHIYTEKSARPANVAKSYDRLLRDNIHGLGTATRPVHDHIESLITAAQHRVKCGDNYNARMLIGNAVDIMNDPFLNFSERKIVGETLI